MLIPWGCIAGLSLNVVCLVSANLLVVMLVRVVSERGPEINQRKCRFLSSDSSFSFSCFLLVLLSIRP